MTLLCALATIRGMRAKWWDVKTGDREGCGDVPEVRPSEYAPAMEDIEIRQAPRAAGTRAEWVTIMALIAEYDREEYRRLRQEAWELLAESEERRLRDLGGAPDSSEKANRN